MGGQNISYDTFELYNKKAKQSYQKGEMYLAKKYYMLAAEQLLEIAKNSKGEMQKAQFMRAKSLITMAESIHIETKSSDHISEDISALVSTAVEPISLEEAMLKLNALEGLGRVKNEVGAWIDQVKVFNLRKEQGMAIPDMSYHMVFMGSPGTGKTTVARIIAQIYHALGLLSKGHLVEVDRSALVAGYIGQTAIKTQEIIQKALGGVLFIDEAYSLAGERNGDFGQEAIDTLLKAMEDNRSDLVVIVAGYDNLMEQFISSNPGLRSRFKNYIHFSDYTGDELYRIFCKFCEQNQYVVDYNARIKIKQYLNDMYEHRGNNFGNARDVRNLFEAIVTRQSMRVSQLHEPSIADMSLITVSDLPFDCSNQKIENDESPITQDKPSIIITEKPPVTEASTPGKHDSNQEADSPEAKILESGNVNNSEFKFDWDSLPSINFEDVAGLDTVKETVKIKVLLPLKNPEAFEGYVKKNGGGLLLYGPPGTGKTMIAAAIANEIGAKFCSVKPSDLIHQGAGQSEKAVRALFAQARSFPCSVIYFDEMDSISPKTTRSQYAKQMRSELLAQLQGIDSYKKENDHILFLIAATNKPWEIDSAFLRPGRFGTRIYVGLPDSPARKYMFEKRLEKIKAKGLVLVNADINMDALVAATEGFNGSDISNLIDRVEEISILRGIDSGEKYISYADFELALSEIPSSVQREDIEKLMEWKAEI